MVLTRGTFALLVLALAATSAAAHKDHAKKIAEQSRAVQIAAQHPRAAARTIPHPMSPAVHEAVKDDLARIEAEAARPWPERLADWVGRTHPFAVHFPLALFPVAWVALLLVRRRKGRPEDTLRALVVVAGAAAAGAALLGWINAGWSLSDADPLLRAHRWLGTLIGLLGAALGMWAWRQGPAIGSRAMSLSLGAITLALLVQGWLGGALIHGMDHLNW
ncbi:MAG TPA: DUF2231 domain-containing protein [Allosphingosinicella sp.]|jgi:uncharacterized membrane protein|uniref:DUF2231 domain-containing protein n=1 Tax=Allosphingosinicella sp. TaxID=2823234 RepID=UPI002F26EF3B